MKILEIERKYLIKFPISLKSMQKIWNSIIAVDHMQQVYLVSDNGITKRIRKIISYGNSRPRFYQTIKISVSPGINEEQEKEISSQQAEKLLHKADPKKEPVYKTRYTFKYLEQVFELDIFEKKLKGLIILEIELDSLDTPVKLPPYLPALKDITKSKKYKNSNLAKTIIKFDNGKKKIGKFKNNKNK